MTLENEIKWMKTQKKALNECPTKDILAGKKNRTVLPSTKTNDGEKQTDNRSYVKGLTSSIAIAKLERK